MPASGPTPCVLVVDDDDDIRDTIAEALCDAGYTVHVATHGGEALADMRNCRPCMVLLDLMMPVVDGWQVMREMAADPALAGIPVCVVSAQSDAAPEASVCVLQKPFSLLTLMQTVNEHCSAVPTNVELIAAPASLVQIPVEPMAVSTSAK